MFPQYYIDSNDFSECKSVNKQECVTSHKRVNCVCNKGIYKGYSTFQLQNYLKTSFCQHYMSIEDTLFCSELHENHLTLCARFDTVIDMSMH